MQIKNVFLQLIQKKSAEDIIVTEICKLAFYRTYFKLGFDVDYQIIYYDQALALEIIDAEYSRYGSSSSVNCRITLQGLPTATFSPIPPNNSVRMARLFSVSL